MNYQERLNKVTTEAAQDWVNKCNTLLNDYDKYFTSFHSKDDKAIERLRSRGSYLASQANNFRRIYEGNSEALSLVDEIVKKLNSAERDSKTSAELKKIGAQVSAQQSASLPNFSAIKNDVENTTKNTPSADVLKKAETRKALFQMSGKQDVNSFSNIVSGFFTDYDKKAENIALEQKNKLMQDKAAAQWSAYRNALNEERAKVGLPSFSQETMDSINKTMTDNMLSSTDNGYTRTQKLNSVKYNQLLFSAISSGDFQSVSESGAKKSAYTLSGNGLQEMHSVINGQQAPSSANRKYTQLNDSERQVWNYYIGKEATDEAIEFIKALEPTLESRLAEKVSEEYDEQGFWGDVKELGVSARGGLQKGVYDIVRSVHGTGEALGNHIPAEMSYALFAPTYSEKLTNAVLADKNGDDGWFFNLLCTALNSSTYQIPAMAISAMGGGMAGYVLQGIGSTTTEAIRNNTESVADVVYGAFQGAMEWAVDKALGGISSQLAGGGTSKLGTFLLNKIDDVIASPGVKKVLSKLAIVGSSVVSENLEELIQMVADPFARAVIYGEELDVSEITLENVIETIIITSLSTLMMSPLTTNSVYNQYQAEKIGSGIIEMGGVESLVKFAEDFDANDTDLYDRVRTAFENKTEPDPMDVVSLYSAAMENYSKFSMDDAKKIAYNIADGGNVEGVARALFNGNTEAATKFIERFSGKQENTNSVKKTKVKRNQNNEYVPQFAENMDERSDFGIDNSVDNTVQNGYNNVGNGIVNDVNTNQGNISEEQREQYTAAILKYKSSESYKINAKLRDNELLSETEQEFVDTLDAALQSLPTYEGTVYRNLMFDDFGGEKAFNDFVKQHAVNKLIVYEQYISCSTEQEGYPVDGEFKAQLFINGKSSRNVDGFGNNMESEVIFPRNSAFIVDKIVYSGNQPIIYLEEVMLNGYQSTEEQSDAVRDMSKLHSKNDNLQGFSKGDTLGDSDGAFRPQSTASGGQRNTVRTGGQRGTVLSTESGEQKVNITNGEADLDDKSAFSMDENSVSQSGTKGITEPDISKDTRSHEERVVEKMSGKESAREKDRREVKRLGKLLGWDVRFDDIYARDKQGNIVYMTDKDGRQILDINGEPIPKRAESKVNKAKKIITFDYSNSKPIKTLLKHELTHFLETNAGVYRDFLNKVIESDAFKNWLQTSKKTDLKTYRDSVIDKYKGTNGFETAESSQISAEYEMVAEFVEENLFGDGTKMVNEIVKQMNNEQRSKFARFIDKIFEKLKNFFSGKKQLSEIETLEQEWLKAYKAAEQTWQQQKNTTENSGEQYAIRKGVAKTGKSVYNEDTHYGEDLKNTQNNLKPTTDREWQVFCRSFANQTNGMKNGDKKVVSIFTADSHYLIDADGYMRGIIVSKSSIDDYNETEVFFDDASTEVFSYQNERNGHRQGNDSDYGHTFENKRTDSFDDELDAFIKRHPEWFGNKKQTYSYSVQRNGAKGKRGNQAELNNSAFSMPTEEKYSLASDNDTLLSMYENGEITREEFLKGFNNKSYGLKEITDLNAEDANTLQQVNKVRKESDGDSDSKFWESLQKSKWFDDGLKAEFAGDEFIEKYKSVSNKEALFEAKKELEEGGADYVRRWHNLDAKHASLIDTAVGFILLDGYRRNGDTVSAVATAEKLREIGTAGGQQIQIFSILGRLSPEAMLQYAQNELDKAFKIMVEKRSKDWIDKNKSKFSLTKEDMEFIERRVLQASILPEGRDKAVCMAEIAARLQDKLPPERSQGFKAWQRISMLLNPKTNVRNILGNATIAPVFIASDFFGTGIDKLISKKTGIRTTGMFGSAGLKENAKAFKKGAWETLDDFKRHINTRNQELNRFDLNTKNMTGKSFNENHNGFLAKQLNDCAKVLNALDRMTSFCLEMGDRPFYEMWFVNSINNQMKLNNVKEPTPEMITIASAEALQRTWQDSNSYVTMVQNIKQGLNGLNIHGYGLGDVFVKFTKTPANLTKAIVDFSPVGLVKGLSVDAVNFKNAVETGRADAITQKKFVDSLSKGIAGTLMYILFAALAANGLITGAGDEDKDANAMEKYILGVPEYSIKLFGKWWSYEWMQPVGGTMAIIADYMQNKEENPGNEWYENIIEAIRAGGEVLYNQSFMQSLQTLFTADGIIDGVVSGVLDDPSVLIPQFISQIASATDKYRRVTYSNKNPWETALNKVKVKLPGLRQTLEIDKDILGRDIENSQDNFFDAFLNPANTYIVSNNDVTDELYNLYKSTGDKTVIPRKAANSVTVKGQTHYFEIKEKNQYQKVMGETTGEILEDIFKSDEYKTLTDSEKVKLINNVFNYAVAMAKAETVIYYDVLSAIYGDALSETKYNSLSEKSKKALAAEYFLSDYYDSKGKSKIKTTEAEYFLEKIIENRNKKSGQYSTNDINKIISNN